MVRSESSSQLSEADASLRASQAGWGVTLRFVLILVFRNRWLTIPAASALFVAAIRAFLP